MEVPTLPGPTTNEANSSRPASLAPNKVWFYASLLAILAGLAALYLLRLDKAPPYFNRDEAGFGLASYLLATTGKDYYGNLLPTYIIYSDRPELGNALICYWGAPFVAAMGLSVVAVRASMAVVGLISLALFGVLGWKLTQNRWIALAGVVILGTTPLFYIQSRIFLDPLLTAPFLIGWLICIVQFEKTRSQWLILLASAILGLGFYSYSVPRMLMPMLLALTLAIFWLWKRQCSFKTVAASVLLFALLLAPAGVFALQHAELYTDRFRFLSWLSKEWTPRVAVAKFVTYYLAQLDPKDLFLTGDDSLVHSTKQVGVMLKATLPLAMVGFVVLLKQGIKWRHAPSVLLLLAFILYPVPNALLDELHRPVRAAHVLPLYGAICVVGMQMLFARLRNRGLGRVILAALAMVFAVEAAVFLWDYHTAYPTRAVAGGQFNGNKPQAFKSLMSMGEKHVYIEAEDPIFPTYVRFFQVAYGFDGEAEVVESPRAQALPAGSLMLTRKPAEHSADFEEVMRILEIAQTNRYYAIMKRK